MSDPVTNVEIEDVLSSIRRLVAEGDKAKHPAPVKASTPVGPPERLVLTPALRVKDDSDKAVDPPVAETVDAVDEPAAVQTTEVVFDRERLEQSDVPFDRASLEATIAELEAAVTEQPDEWEPDGSEVITDTDLDPGWARAGFASDQPVEDAEEVTEDEAEAAQWDAAPVADALEDEVETDTHDHIEFATRTRAAPETAPEMDSVADALEDQIAREAIETSIEDTVVPPMTFRHSVDPDLDDDEVDDLRADDTDDSALEAYLSDDTVVDESALRQLVLEIVREELQGKLGERITRNVRKLVRREIHRVLSSQDLD